MKTKKTRQPKKIQQVSKPTIPANPAPAEYARREEISAILKLVADLWSAVGELRTAAPTAPSPEKLAMIAATLGKGATENPATAIAYAAKLYDVACAHLESKARLSAAYQAEADKNAAIPQPGKFPAPFADFLRLIVNAKTPADSTKRFRDYHRYRVKSFCTMGKPERYPEWAEWAAKKHYEEMKPEARHDPKWAGMTEQQIGEALLESVIEKKVADELAEYQHYGISDRDSWCREAKQYLHWWATQKSAQARAAAKKLKK